MQVVARLRYLRIAPRKVRLVADLLRGKSVQEAQTILNFTVKRASQPILKLLKSAVASARHNFQLEEKNLYIAKINVDEGPKYKRWRARARGQAAEIQKKTSHITLVLDEIVQEPKKSAVLKRPKKEVKEEGLSEIKKAEKESKVIETHLKPRPELEVSKPKVEKGFKRIFRRKSF